MYQRSACKYQGGFEGRPELLGSTIREPPSNPILWRHFAPPRKSHSVTLGVTLVRAGPRATNRNFRSECLASKLLGQGVVHRAVVLFVGLVGTACSKAESEHPIASDPAEPVEVARAIAPPHAGILATTRSGRVEVLADRRRRLRVWLFDASGALRPSTAILVFINVGTERDVQLAPTGDHFEGLLPPSVHGHTNVSITIEAGTSTESAELALDVEGEGGV